MTENDPRARDTPIRGPVDPGERAALIGRRLRQIFDEAAAEPIPDAFKDLLSQLE